MHETERETARVYDLAAFRRAREARRGSTTGASERIPAVTGGAWYHEAAIRDDDRPRRT